MAHIKISGHKINVDIREELEAFGWTRPRWTSDKLIAASPFRYDSTPSFFVSLETGGWADSGAYDTDYEHGNLTKLLAFLRNETQEETEEYLLDKYGVDIGDERRELVLPTFKRTQSFQPLPSDIIDAMPSPYLTKRGISESVQSLVGVGKSKHHGFVAIPWHTADGRLANVKYRATRGKTFFYEKGAYPIRKSVWGANFVTGEVAIVCEAEIDAMSWMTAGFQAVAIGGVSFNKTQADILRRLPSKTLLIAGDNDKAGAKFIEVVAREVRDSVDVGVVTIEGAYKDANEALQAQGSDALRRYVEEAVIVPRRFHLR